MSYYDYYVKNAGECIDVPDHAALEKYFKEDSLDDAMFNCLYANTSLKEKLQKDLHDYLNKKNVKTSRVDGYNVEEIYKKISTVNIKEIADKLPRSLYMQFTFKLGKPFITGCDDKFRFIPNSLKKETVFRVPVFEGSSWKGCLHSAMCMRIGEEKDAEKKLNLRLAKIRLFGSEKEMEGTKEYFEHETIFPEKIRQDYQKKLSKLVNADGFRKGRLLFFPTFFDTVSLEVFNPHDRITRAGKVPFWAETVPVGKKGVFSVLYFPFDVFWKHKEGAVEEQIKEDTSALVHAVHDTFRKYGFGAKSREGFGRAKQIIEDFMRSADDAGKGDTFDGLLTLCEKGAAHGKK